MRNNRMPNRLIPENIAFRVTKHIGKGKRLWGKLYDICLLLDLPVQQVIEKLIIDWHAENILDVKGKNGHSTNDLALS